MSKIKKALRSAAATLGIEHAEPQVIVPAPPELSSRTVTAHHAPLATQIWPADKPLPKEYVARQRNMQPCPSCRRITMEAGGLAVVVTSRPRGLRWFRCRACGHRWKLPDRGN